MAVVCVVSVVDVVLDDVTVKCFVIGLCTSHWYVYVPGVSTMSQAAVYALMKAESDNDGILW